MPFRPTTMAAVLFCTALYLTGPTSWGAAPTDGASEQVRDEARQLAYDGIRALRAGRYEEAISFLQRAEDKFHAPTNLLYIARAQVGLEQLVAAHDTYVAILSEALPNYAPTALHEARREAAVEEEQLRGRIATVRVTLEGGEAATIAVDGQPIESSRLAYPIAVTAGEHRIEASATDGRHAVQSTTVANGESRAVTLSLPPVRGDENAADASVAAASDGSGALTVVGAIFTAMGGAALIAGAVTGGMTVQRAAEIDDTCGGSVCPTAEEPTVQDARTLGDVTTALFVAGGVLAATGVVLLGVALGDEPSGEPVESARLDVELTPMGVSLTGAF